MAAPAAASAAPPAPEGGLWLEDFAPGQVYAGGTITLDEAAIRDFAARFDPQPAHLDPEAARESLFGGLVASGWHTAAATMRLLVAAGPAVAGGMVGAGVEELRWPRPTRPGDTLTCRSEVLEVRRSATRPSRGIVRLRTVTLDQAGEPVQIMVCSLVVPSREQPAG